MSRRGGGRSERVKITLKKKNSHVSHFFQNIIPAQILHPIFYSNPIKKSPSFRMLVWGIQ